MPDLFLANAPGTHQRPTIHLEKLQSGTYQTKPIGRYPLDYGRWGSKSSATNIPKGQLLIHRPRRRNPRK